MSRDTTYTVEVGYISDAFHICGGYDIDCKTATAARNLALDACKKTKLPVYVSFYRASDGQKGYLNRNGDHEIIGNNWNA